MSAAGDNMDSFTGRRRATWQSKAPAWPFLVGAFVVVGVGCFLIAPWFSGIVFGDGTHGGRAVVWMKAASNAILPGVVLGVAVGAVLNAVYLAPARRHTALKWTAFLVLAGALVGVPRSIVQAIETDRAGYTLRLANSAAEAGKASRQSEADLYRRLGLLLRNNPFDPGNLGATDGLEDARKAIAGHRDLIATARRDYDPGQVAARAALANGIVGSIDREAVLQRFDAAAVERKVLMERFWAANDRIISLREQELAALEGNRSGWKSENGIGLISSRPLLIRIQSIEERLRDAAGEMSEAEAALTTHDYQADAGIDRLLAAAQ